MIDRQHPQKQQFIYSLEEGERRIIAWYRREAATHRPGRRTIDVTFDDKGQVTRLEGYYPAERL
jgi:hypothetical protein